MTTSRVYVKVLAIAGLLGAVSTIGSFTWGIGRGFADDYVDSRINMSQFASQNALNAIDKKTQMLEQQLDVVDKNINSLNKDVETINKLLEESRGDIKLILRGVNRLSE